MIFRINPGFINSCPPARLSDIACAAARNGHYLRTDRHSRSAIRDAVRQHGSTTEKQRSGPILPCLTRLEILAAFSEQSK